MPTSGESKRKYWVMETGSGPKSENAEVSKKNQGCDIS